MSGLKWFSSSTILALAYAGMDASISGASALLGFHEIVARTL